MSVTKWRDCFYIGSMDTKMSEQSGMFFLYRLHGHDRARTVPWDTPSTWPEIKHCTCTRSFEVCRRRNDGGLVPDLMHFVPKGFWLPAMAENEECFQFSRRSGSHDFN